MEKQSTTQQHIVQMDAIRKLAWSFHYTTGLEFEELVGEASLAYAEALQDFDPDKEVKVLTYCYGRMKNHLISYCRGQKYRKYITDYEEEHSGIYEHSMENSMLDKFTGKAREVVEWIIEEALSPAQILTRTKGDIQHKELNESIINWDGNPKTIRGEISKFLRAKGWKYTAIWDTMREIKETVRQN